jgi:hypothetical protein
MTTFSAVAIGSHGELKTGRFGTAGEALHELSHGWQLPGLVLVINASGMISPLWRLDGCGVIYDHTEYPVADVAGSVWCPQCHARPGQQDPQYSAQGDRAVATGVFRCRACGNIYRPAPLT